MMHYSVQALTDPFYIAIVSVYPCLYIVIFFFMSLYQQYQYEDSLPKSKIVKPLFQFQDIVRHILLLDGFQLLT